jgi:mannitol 2-dehydrogenase
MCAGIREDGSEIAANDPVWEDLRKTALAAKTDPGLWLAQDLYCGEFGGGSQFTKAFGQWLNGIWKNGSRAVLAEYISHSPSSS